MPFEQVLKQPSAKERKAYIRGACGGSLRLWAEAFTLIELLVVIAVIAVLAALLFPALNQAKGKVLSTSCGNNLRQLQLGWKMYADDNNDFLAPNEWFYSDRINSGELTNSWVIGNAFADTATFNIQNGVLFPYNHSAGIYHCPADKSTVLDLGRQLRTRSFSMSGYMNNHSPMANGFSFKKYASITKPPPEKIFVFIHENAVSIEDGYFWVTQPGDWARGWGNLPATLHQNGDNLSFADGHYEHWKWVESNTLRLSQQPGGSLEVTTSPNDRDLTRLWEAVPNVVLVGRNQ